MARIVRPHGLAGEIGVLPHWEQSELLLGQPTVVVIMPDGGRQRHVIAAIRRHDRGYLLRFEGTTNRDAAQALVGGRIAVERSELPAASDDEIYLADCVGMTVMGPDGELLGRVVEVRIYPSVDALIIQGEDGSHIEQPWVDQWIGGVDTSTGCIHLSDLGGLLR